jgi:hypothetical protein
MRDDSCIAELDAEQAIMTSVSVGEARIRDVNQTYTKRRRVIAEKLRQRGIPDPNPYADLWAWYHKWSSGELPTYKSRRLYLVELFKPTFDALARESAGRIAEPVVNPTGWARVDRNIDSIRRQLEIARDEEDFQTVGLVCRETLISLGQAVYDPARHLPADGIIPSTTDGYRMLDAYFTAELGGGTNEIIRSHAKSALKLANDLQHRRTASFRDAALCAEASRTVTNLVAIVAGRR